MYSHKTLFSRKLPIPPIRKHLPVFSESVYSKLRNISNPRLQFAKCFIPKCENPGYVSYPGMNSSDRVCRLKNKHPLMRRAKSRYTEAFPLNFSEFLDAKWIFYKRNRSAPSHPAPTRGNNAITQQAR